MEIRTANRLNSLSRIVINRFLLPGSNIAWRYFQQMKEIPLKYFKTNYSWKDLELLVYDLLKFMVPDVSINFKDTITLLG